MDIVVCLKQTFDTEATISLDNEGKISGDGVKLIVNPYDECALEEALRLQEKHGGTVTIVSVGDERTQDALRSGLAMGADKAVLIRKDNLEEVDGWVTANLLAKALSSLPYHLVLTGRIAVDDGNAQVAARLAEALGIPFVDSITNLNIEGDQALAVYEGEGGAVKARVQLPAVFSAQKGLNEPRYPVMAGILKAKKKPLDVLEASELCTNSDDLRAKLQHVAYILPPERKVGRVLSGTPEEAVSELARALREDEKII